MRESRHFPINFSSFRAGKIIETFGFSCSFFSNLSKNGDSLNVLNMDFIKAIHVAETPIKIATSM